MNIVPNVRISKTRLRSSAGASRSSLSLKFLQQLWCKMFFQFRQSNQPNCWIWNFFFVNFCDILAGLAYARPRLQHFEVHVKFQCRVHPYVFRIKSFQTVWISGVFHVRYTRTFSKIKPSKVWISRVFKARYAHTFLRIKVSNSLNFTCCHCKVHPHSFKCVPFCGEICAKTESYNFA